MAGCCRDAPPEAGFGRLKVLAPSLQNPPLQPGLGVLGLRLRGAAVQLRSRVVVARPLLQERVLPQVPRRGSATAAASPQPRLERGPGRGEIPPEGMKLGDTLIVQEDTRRGPRGTWVRGGSATNVAS